MNGPQRLSAKALWWMRVQVTRPDVEIVKVRELARDAISAGLIPEETKAKAVEDAVTDLFRRQLRRKNRLGLPWFGSVLNLDDGKLARGYVQLQLFSRKQARDYQAGRRELITRSIDALNESNEWLHDHLGIPRLRVTIHFEEERHDAA
jgi:hypothetical protein